MLRSKRQLKTELLEPRLALSGIPWFDDSGQQPGINSFGVPLGDLDGDGDLDAFVSCFSGGQWSGACRESAVWLNDGLGNFSKRWSGRLTQVGAVALGDVDGDQDLDAFLTMCSGPEAALPVQVWLNDGSGQFTDSQQRLGRGGYDADLGDLDGDGDLDAFVAKGGVWLNDGHGTFVDSDQPAGRRTAPSIGLGDLDGDQDLDAYLGVGVVYLNDGKGGFTDTGQRLGRGSASSARLGDLDNDGDLDAFVAYGNPAVGYLSDEVWLNDGHGMFTDSGQRLGSAIGRAADLGDLDGDGDLDAFVANGVESSGQPNEVWLNDGRAQFVLSGQRIGSGGYVSVSLGDLDGDEDLDAFVGQLRSSNTRDVWNSIWSNRLLTAGDANRDGRFDQRDIVEVLQGGKYNTGKRAVWTTGDWNLDAVFDQLDIVAALQTGTYLQDV